ncbi:MAG TPA: tRNA preQ1(34) S-adenosylmethionine ribosyltransferase-isomerase QueA [Gemmatimonadaceae bacterium]|nr:tRNA preQ1(34) S-adenosylmethionine ribosyltransferase-isomerase QueA [Gemmatimonadaceae bacterium]
MSDHLAPGTRTADFDFELPPHLVAQTPAARRDESRLMVVDRSRGTIEHRRFRDLAEMIPAGDALVLNTTRVLRARLLGQRDSGAPAEVFLLKALPERGEGVFEAMVRPGGKVRPGRVVHVAPELEVEVLEITDRRTRIVRLRTPLEVGAAIERFGHVPLPPYIARGDEGGDVERYQTVYARETGSVAAPTAGLHFTPELLERLERRGVRRVDVLLHVGAGTFKPVEVDDLAQHVMHEEWYDLPAAAAATLNATRDAGGAVWAVGTTSCRTLESAVGEDGRFAARSGETRIFIRPPHRFRAVDKLVTNFHLPRSTLIMLVAAFAGYELTMRAYREAIDAGYRFYSYGDAMLLL